MKNLQWTYNDWNGQYFYSINDEGSCIQIGSAIAGVAGRCGDSVAYKIRRSELDRLSSYYIEAGLMNPKEAEEVFTEAGKRLARRQSIVGNNQYEFRVVHGKISTAPDDEIPF